MKKQLNKISHQENLKIGDFLIIQSYSFDLENKNYKVSKPKMVIYLGSFAADQCMGFNYVEWINENRKYLVNASSEQNDGDSSIFYRS